MRHYIYMNSPVGMLTLGEENGYITHILFGKRQLEGYFLENDLLSMAKSQLNEYFDGVRKSFALPLMPEGTDFQKSVWRALTDIDYGTTATYGQIAEMIGSPKAARAVGMANNKNPVAIVVPWHRIVGADGSLTGFAGGIDTKRFLLALEEENM